MREEVTIDLHDGTEELRECRAAAVTMASKAGFEDNDLWDIASAVFEACVNAITHGRARNGSHVTLSVRAFDDRFEAEVKDYGCGLPRTGNGQMPPPSSHRGRGIPLMKAFMDEVRVESNDGCKVTLVKYVHRN